MRFIDFPTHSDERGSLTVIEENPPPFGLLRISDLPFEVRRVFYIYGVPQGATRAKHAHHECEQLLIAVAGSLAVMIEGKRFVLESPGRGLYLPPMVWRELCDFSPDAVCLVLCSEPYDPMDYIRDYKEYEELKK